MYHKTRRDPVLRASSELYMEENKLRIYWERTVNTACIFKFGSTSNTPVYGSDVARSM